jgi:hypothetical protein
MKFPNHIILDISKTQTSTSSQYWVFRYLLNFDNSNYIIDDFSYYKKFYISKDRLMLNKLLKSQKKYTVRYSHSNPAIFLSNDQKKLYKNLFTTRLKVKHRLLFSKHWGKEAYDYLYNKPKKFDEKSIRRLFKNFKFKEQSHVFTSTNLWSLFDIHFLRKEKIYTKLKYSRVPQYDIVSAGVAAIFAGLIGYLITEKFGFELLDSGDFYYMFMYFVFLFFFCRLFLRITNNNNYGWNCFSYKWFLHFYKTLAVLAIKFIRNLYFIKK